jgi:uncharacterized protein HemY
MVEIATSVLFLMVFLLVTAFLFLGLLWAVKRLLYLIYDVKVWIRARAIRDPRTR